MNVIFTMRNSRPTEESVLVGKQKESYGLEIIKESGIIISYESGRRLTYNDD